MLEIWSKRRKNMGKLRIAVPIVFYHGQKTWKYKRFAEYFEGEGYFWQRGCNPGQPPIFTKWLSFIPEFDYILVNLQEKSDAWISDQIQLVGLRVALLLMRHIRAEDLLDRLARIFKGREELIESPEAREEYEEISLYLYQGSKIPHEKIDGAMDQNSIANISLPKQSLGWRFKEMGRKEGKAEMAKSLLEQGVDPAIIANATGFSMAEIESLKSEMESEG